MPRYSRNFGESSKIRKRGSSTSSSSSSVVQSYRFKRAVLVNKRGGGGGGGGSMTPVPVWRSPKITESPKYPPSLKGKQTQVSARKLAATLWEMNDVPSSSRLKHGGIEDKGINKDSRTRTRTGGSVRSGSFPYHLSDPSHSPVSQRTERSRTISVHKRSLRPRPSDRYNQGFESSSNAGLMEIEARSRGRTSPRSVVGVKTCLKDISSGLITSKELLKILGRIWGVEEYHSSAKSLVLALRSELDRVHSQVDQLVQEELPDHKEINNLMKHFAEKKAAWKSKMQGRIEATLKAISGDLEIERKLRRRTESLNKSLARELAETKISLSKAVKELEGEKRSRAMVEEACNELARGVGEDREEAEQMKRESVKVLEEVEKEREMFHLADVLREERVQMKLLEARHHFEEKNAAVEKLRNDLESFLRSKQAKENQCKKGKDVGNMETGEHCKDLDLGEDSAESDLHSIELNMDNNRNYMWNYAVGAGQEDPKRLSSEKEINGRKSSPEKLARGRTSLERYMSDGVEWGIISENFPIRGDGYGRCSYSNAEKEAHGENFEAETKEYKYMKGIRDHILASSRLVPPPRGFVSPTRRWTQL